MDTMVSGGASWRSSKTLLVVLGMLLIAAVVIVAIVRDRIVNPPQWQVSMSGQGRASYEPDVARINLGVQVDKAPEASEALAQLNAKIEKIYAAVSAVGIPTQNIQTQNYMLYSQYDYIDGASKPAGYNANQQLVIKVENAPDSQKLIEDVIAAATKAGVNQINGISFELANMNDLRQQARLTAIADAKAKAQTTADALGVELGEVVGWWENVVAGPDGPLYYKGDMGMGGYGGGGGSPTVPTGSQELIVEVTINYRIK